MEVLEEIKRQLKDPGKPPCHVAATSLIEVGAELDFPAVFRAEAGLDSILRAAELCNREGENPLKESFVYIFEPEDTPPASLKKYIEIYRETAEFTEDLASPEAVEAYFDAISGKRTSSASGGWMRKTSCGLSRTDFREGKCPSRRWTAGSGS